MKQMCIHWVFLHVEPLSKFLMVSEREEVQTSFPPPPRMECIFRWSISVAYESLGSITRATEEIKQSKPQDKVHASILLLSTSMGSYFVISAPMFRACLVCWVLLGTLTFLMPVSCKSSRCTFPSFLGLSFEVFGRVCCRDHSA